MPSTLSYTIPVPLPASLPPTTVLNAIQTYEPLITSHPYLVSFRRRPVDVDEIIDDPFFRDDGFQLAAFEVVERVVLVPGVASKNITIPCVMQALGGGVRCRSLAQGGVRVWCTWSVRPRDPAAADAAADRASLASRATGRSSAGGRSDDDTAAADYPYDGCEWELFEEAKVECSSLVKPFVGKTFVGAHKTILKRMIDDIIRGQQAGRFGFQHRYS